MAGSSSTKDLEYFRPRGPHFLEFDLVGNPVWPSPASQEVALRGTGLSSGPRCRRTVQRSQSVAKDGDDVPLRVGDRFKSS